jgi:hypothetical protein
LIADRSIKESDFGKIQKNREQEMEYWSDKYRAIEENEKDVKAGIVAAKNHFAAFGAATANMVRVMRGLESAEWGMQKEIAYDSQLQFPDEQPRHHKSKQRTLLDYPSTE